MDIIAEKGWTVTYIPWEDMEGRPRAVSYTHLETAQC